MSIESRKKITQYPLFYNSKKNRLQEKLKTPRKDNYLLVHGDTYDLISALPKESIDLIITSPPYWGQRTYGLPHNWDILNEWRAEGNNDNDIPTYEWYKHHGGILGLEPIPEWYIHRLVEIFNKAKNCLKPKGNLWVNLGDTYFARWSSIRDGGRQGLGENGRIRRRVPMGKYRQEKQLLMIPARFAIEMQKHRWILRNDMIWFKPNIPPRPEKDRVRLAHEHFFHFVKRPVEGRPKYYYNIDEVEDGRCDVVICNVSKGAGDHSATFPEEIIRPRILSSCPPNGLILDPFCGTGTALVTALENNRRAVGFDIVEDYLIHAKETIKSGHNVDGKTA